MKNRIWALIALMAVTIMSCTPADGGDKTADEEAWISASTDALSFECDATEGQVIEVMASNLDVLEFTCADDWCTITSEKTEGSVLATVTVEKNTDKARSTEIQISCEDVLSFVMVDQLGFEPEIKASVESVSVKAEGEEFTVGVITNLGEVTVECEAEWLTYTEENGTYKFTAAENTVTEERTATIVFAAGELEAEVTVTQAASEKEPEVEQPDRVDTGDDVRIACASVETPSSNANYPIENVFDGDLNSYWQTPTKGVESPATITFTFDNLPRIESMVYYPTDEYGQWGEIEIAYYNTDTKREQTLGSFDLGMTSDPQIVEFGQSLLEVQQIIVKVKTAKGRASTTGVLAGAKEVEFFRANNYTQFKEIFTDSSCAEFVEGFDVKNVDKIEDETLRYIATKMTAEDYDPTFRVDYAEPYQHPDVDSKRFHTNTYCLVDNVTGIVYLEPGKHILCLGPTGGLSVKMKVVNWKSELKDGDHAEYDYVLREGINEVNLKDGGNAYIMYHTSNSSAQPIRYNFVDGAVNGYYDVAKHQDSEFKDILYMSRWLRHEYDFPTSFDLVGVNSIVTLPSDLLYKQNVTGKSARAAIAVWDEIVDLEEEFQGHVKYNTGGHANRAWFTNRYSSFMWAGSYVMGFNVANSSVADIMCNATKLKNNVWGPAHELGHCNQIRKGLKWVGMTEVSNNFMSCYVITHYTGATALKTGGKYFHAHRDIGCKQGTNHIMACGYDTPYLKLVPFWQLHLYYHDILGMDFYPDIHNTIRNYADCETMSDQEAMLRFCELVSSYTGENLTDFFEYWKMLIPVNAWISDYGARNMVVEKERVDAAREKMALQAAPKRDIRFINEDNKELYRNNPEVTAGTFSVASNGYTFTMSGWANAVAYIVVDEEGIIRQVADQNCGNSSFKVVTNECKWYYTKKTTVDGKEVETKVYSPDNTNSQLYLEQEFCGERTYVVENPRVYGVRADGTWVPALNNPF